MTGAGDTIANPVAHFCVHEAALRYTIRESRLCTSARADKFTVKTLPNKKRPHYIITLRHIRQNLLPRARNERETTKTTTKKNIWHAICNSFLHTAKSVQRGDTFRLFSYLCTHPFRHLEITACVNDYQRERKRDSERPSSINFNGPLE